MSKLVKTVALVAVAVAVVAVAAPFAGAIAYGLGASAAIATSIASAVVGIGFSIGLSAITTHFRKSPSQSQSIVDRLQRTVVPSAARKIVFGRTAAGADERFFETFGAKKDQHAQVIALASHKCSVKEFYVENDLTWSNGSLAAHTDGISSFRAVDEGSPSNAQAMGSGAYWTASSSFSGCSYLAITYRLDSKAWPQGLPSKITTKVEGCPVYDPRLDSTRGGAGSHRVDDQSTWAFHHGSVEIGRNPALCLLTYLIGWRVNGKLMWGMGVPISRINLDNFRVYANVCEERVQTADGSTTQRYTADGIVSTADSHESIISALTAAMGSCKLTDVGGQYSFVGGYDDSLGPKQSFSADDLRGGVGSPAPFIWTPAGPSRETYNIVRGQFADPAQLYQLVDWGQVETDPLADGVERTLSLNLGFVSRAETCQRIAKQFLMREAVTPGFFQAVFGPRAFGCQVGSLVTLSLPAMGWNNKLFRVEKQDEDPDLNFPMTLREESPLVYAWDKDEAKPLPVSIRPPGYDASMTVTPTNVTLTSTAYIGVS